MQHLLVAPPAGLRARFARSPIGRLCAALQRRGEAGMAIAEYAIGILIVAAVGLVIFTMIRGGVFSSLLSEFVKFLFETIEGLWT
jgi:hypothetical protein